MPATVAPQSFSGGVERFRRGLFHSAITASTPANETTLTKNAAATPKAAITRPARAGPTARAKLNSIPFRAEAAAKSSFGTNSGRMARQDGASNASPADSAKVNARRTHG